MKKKLFKSLIALVMASLLCLGLFACGNKTAWKEKDVTLKDWGKVEENGGFIAETENYYYFINGIGVSTDDNTFGTPVKGSLMATKKDFSESCIVVPKLFVASDYKSGLAIYGDYVYYGTPCTSKDSSGKVASSNMTFARTKLDGTDTTEYFTISSLSAEYRILQGSDDVVYIVYYDTETTSLVCYNTESKTANDICVTKTDAEKETLDTYKFSDNGEDVVLTYTTKVYIEDYDEELAEEEGYTRATASYNNVYAYKVGDDMEGDCAGKLIASGDKNIPVTYTLSFVKGDYVFIKEADSTTIGGEKTFAISLSDAYTGKYNANKQLVTKTDYLVDTALIKGLDEVYLSDGTFIKKSGLVGDITLTEKYIAKVSTVSKLLFINGDYIYYINSSNNIARIKIANVNLDAENDADVTEQIVSNGTITTTWYAPELIDGKIFYSDGTAKGCSYVTYVNIGSELKVDKDDDGNVTKLYLEGQKTIGKKVDADIATYVSEQISEIGAALDSGKFTIDSVEDGVPHMTEVVDAKEAYDALTEEQKELVSEDTLNLLNKYLEAERIQAYLYELKDFDTKTTAQKEALEEKFNSAQAQLENLRNSEEYNYSDIRALFAENVNYDYYSAYKYFTAE